MQFFARLFPDAKPETEADPVVTTTMSQAQNYGPHSDLMLGITETADHPAPRAAGVSQSRASVPEAAEDQGGGRATSSSNAPVELSPSALIEPTAPVATATENAGLSIFAN